MRECFLFNINVHDESFFELTEQRISGGGGGKKYGRCGRKVFYTIGVQKVFKESGTEGKFSHIKYSAVNHKENRMKKKPYIIIMLIMLLFTVQILNGCGRIGKRADKQIEKPPAATYFGGNSTISEVMDDLKNAKLANTDIFFNWVSDFAKTAGKNAALKDEWISLDKLNFDLPKTMDGWEDNHDYSDADCRMTAFLLLDGILKSEKEEEAYTGTYLMFDMEAIDSSKEYTVIKNKIKLFTTVFGDKEVLEGETPRTIFAETWEKYGIKVDSDKVSLLSVVMYDSDFKTSFVGHTGVLVKDKKGLLFVEKIAFEQPYQATRFNNMDELIDMLSKRAEYFGETGQSGPYIYINGDFYSELKAL